MAKKQKRSRRQARTAAEARAVRQRRPSPEIQYRDHPIMKTISALEGGILEMIRLANASGNAGLETVVRKRVSDLLMYVDGANTNLRGDDVDHDVIGEET